MSGEDPYRTYASPSVASTPSSGASTPQFTPAQPQFTPAPTDRTRTLAIVAVVLAGLSLIGTILIGLGSAFWWVGSGMSGEYEDDMGTYMGEDQWYGTAPQVVAGQAYTGERLAKEVATTGDSYGYLVEGLTCEDVPQVKSAAESLCTGTVDGDSASLTVRFEDEEGHFTVTQTD